MSSIEIKMRSSVAKDAIKTLTAARKLLKKLYVSGSWLEVDESSLTSKQLEKFDKLASTVDSYSGAIEYGKTLGVKGVVGVCAEGAVCVIDGPGLEPANKLLNLVAKSDGFASIINLNDSTDRDTTVAAFDEAIKLAKNLAAGAGRVKLQSYEDKLKIS